MFNVGDIVQLKISGERVMVLACQKAAPIGEEKERTVYTVRLPDYKRAMDIQDFELEAIASPHLKS